MQLFHHAFERGLYIAVPRFFGRKRHHLDRGSKLVLDPVGEFPEQHVRTRILGCHGSDDNSPGFSTSLPNASLGRGCAFTTKLKFMNGITACNNRLSNPRRAQPIELLALSTRMGMILSFALRLGAIRIV